MEREGALYDTIGRGYARGRRPDPRIAARLAAATDGFLGAYWARPEAYLDAAAHRCHHVIDQAGFPSDAPIIDVGGGASTAQTAITRRKPGWRPRLLRAVFHFLTEEDEREIRGARPTCAETWSAPSAQVLIRSRLSGT